MWMMYFCKLSFLTSNDAGEGHWEILIGFPGLERNCVFMGISIECRFTHSYIQHNIYHTHSCHQAKDCSFFCFRFLAFGYCSRPGATECVYKLGSFSINECFVSFIRGHTYFFHHIDIYIHIYLNRWWRILHCLSSALMASFCSLQNAQMSPNAHFVYNILKYFNI